MEGEERERKPVVSEESEKAIQVKVRPQTGNQSELEFRMKKKMKMFKIMDAFASKQGLERNKLVFMFDGMRINPDATAQDLELEDGDVIDVFLHQVGGAAA